MVMPMEVMVSPMDSQLPTPLSRLLMPKSLPLPPLLPMPALPILMPPTHMPPMPTMLDTHMPIMQLLMVLMLLMLKLMLTTTELMAVDMDMDTDTDTVPTMVDMVDTVLMDMVDTDGAVKKQKTNKRNHS